MKFPKEAAKYIALQRLETQKLGKSIHYTTLGKVAYQLYEKVPLLKQAFSFYSRNIEPAIRHKSIIEDYAKIMTKEFLTIKAHLPSNIKHVVGIGPGVAGLEVLLSQYYSALQKPLPTLILIDKSKIDPIKYGFHETAAAYNSLSLAKNILTDNGQPSEKIYTYESKDVDKCAQQFNGQIDLITSLIAWGFHFPVDTYLNFAKALLTQNGQLIIDVRKETDGLTKLKAAFQTIEIIYDDDKFSRVLAISPVLTHPQPFPSKGKESAN